MSADLLNCIKLLNNTLREDRRKHYQQRQRLIAKVKRQKLKIRVLEGSATPLDLATAGKISPYIVTQLERDKRALQNEIEELQLDHRCTESLLQQFNEALGKSQEEARKEVERYQTLRRNYINAPWYIRLKRVFIPHG